MAGWYRVVKTIKGHKYLYEQQTYREGGRVLTRNPYLGRADGDGGKSAANPGHLSLPATPLFTDPSDFGRALASQFDAPAWGRDAQQQVLGGKTPKQRRKRRPQQTVTTTPSELSHIRQAMNTEPLSSLSPGYHFFL
jgi:hypothetical protein